MSEEKIKTLIAAVQAADKKYAETLRGDETEEACLWDDKREARKELRQAIHETFGVTIDELKNLTRT